MQDRLDQLCKDLSIPADDQAKVCVHVEYMCIGCVVNILSREIMRVLHAQ